MPRVHESLDDAQLLDLFERIGTLATAISLVWARCNNTSATDQPGQRDGSVS